MKFVIAELQIIVLTYRNLLATFDNIHKLLSNRFKLEDENINYVFPIQR